jgi:hypothetical protein
VITVGPETTPRLIESLTTIDGVITLAVHEGDSINPPGDVVSVTVLNRDVDAVLAAATGAAGNGTLSVATSGVDSLTDVDSQDLVRADVDEATWEEAQTALRRHTRPTLNFFITTAAGGVVAASGLAASSGVTEATALVAAGIMAPAFEPLARVALGGVLHHRRTIQGGLVAAVLSYVTLIASALLTMLILRAAGHDYA